MAAKPEEVAKALRLLGFPPTDTARAIREAFLASTADVARVMWAAAFSLPDLQSALGAVFGLTIVEIGQLLASLGMPWYPRTARSRVRPSDDGPAGRPPLQPVGIMLLFR